MFRVEHSELGDWIAGLRDEVGSADGTRGVRSQPLVDALGVEHVVALGDQTQHFVVLELIQADGALERVLPDFEPLDCGVLEGGEGVDDGGVKSAGGAAAGAAGVGSAGADTGGLGVGAVADIDGEEAHEEEGGDEDDDDDGHGGAEALVAVGVGAGLSSDGGDCRREEQQEEESEGAMLGGVG